MRGRLFPVTHAVLLAFVFASPAFSAQAPTSTPATPVATSLKALDAWLASGPNQESWSKYLNLPALQAEVAKGNQADRAAVAEVLKRLNSQAPGLELEPFARLRDAVTLWLGDLTIAQAPSLPEAALAAEATFQPVTDATVASSKAALQSALTRLERYLSGSNGAAWKKFLRTDDLDAQLKAESPDPEVLTAIYGLFTTNQVGLELPIFAHVADALEQYHNDLLAKKDDAQAQYSAQLKSLAENLKKLAEGPNDEAAQAVAESLGWLARHRQAPALVRAVRAKFLRPNLHVRVSERLATAGIAQKIDEQTPVRDNILGTSIQGTGHTVGNVSGNLLASEVGALLETALTGTVHSRTVGQNGPATIYSSGVTKIDGRKRIIINQNGLSSFPATATANTSTTVTGIGGSGIVQRAAPSRIAEQKPQAERIAASHAADRVRHRMEKQIDEQLSKAQGEYLNRFRNPLLRRRQFPELDIHTTDDLLLLTARQATASQSAATAIAPGIDVPHDIAVQFHESMFNNIASSALAGLTLTEAELQKRVIDLKGSLPEQLKSDEDRDPWSITFAKQNPITVKFTDGGAQVTVRGQRYTSGEREFRGMNVTADYKYAIDGPGVKLTRQGDLTILPPGFVQGQTRMSAQQISLRTLLQKRFGKLFEQEIKAEALILPGRWRQAGQLELKQLNSANGWLVLAWVENGIPAPPEEPANPAPAAKKVAQVAR